MQNNGNDDYGIGLTAVDLAKLAYPFRRADHEFLQGYVYIQEEAIAERLDIVDPCWSLTIEAMKDYSDSIVVHSRLTIKGVNRSNVGGNPVQREKEEKKKEGDKWVSAGKYIALPLYNQADNGVNAYKAAATDALKRCARLFGVGRYLLSAPKEGGAFDAWLGEEHKQAKAQLDVLTGKLLDTETGEIVVADVRPTSPPTSGLPASTAPTNGSDDFDAVFPPPPVTLDANDSPPNQYRVTQVKVVPQGNSHLYLLKAGDTNITLYGGDWFRKIGQDPEYWKSNPNKWFALKPSLNVVADFDGEKWHVAEIMEAVS